MSTLPGRAEPGDEPGGVDQRGGGQGPGPTAPGAPDGAAPGGAVAVGAAPGGAAPGGAAPGGAAPGGAAPGGAAPGGAAPGGAAPGGAAPGGAGAVGEAGEEIEGPGGVRLWRVAAPVEVPVDLPVEPVEPVDLSLDPVAADGLPLDPVAADGLPLDPVEADGLPLDPVEADGLPLDPVEAHRRRDRAEVERLLGRPPRSSFAVVVRDLATGSPVVIRNPPLLDDGTPMPTRYWLVAFTAEVGTLEASGGVRAAEAAVDAEALAAAHARHAAERDAALPEGWTGPSPSGGVGGTRRGVKCLHTHYANWLATGDDPVGAWTHEHLSP